MSDTDAPLMTPELQAQLAALQQQAMEQLRALVEALRGVEGQLPPAPLPEEEPGSTITPWVAPPEPVLLPPDAPFELSPREVFVPEPKAQDGGTGLWGPPEFHPFARLAVMPAEELPPEALAVDLLSVLPPPPAASAPGAPEPQPAAALGGIATPEAMDWAWPDLHRAGAEGGTF